MLSMICRRTQASSEPIEGKAETLWHDGSEIQKENFKFAHVKGNSKFCTSPRILRLQHRVLDRLPLRGSFFFFFLRLLAPGSPKLIDDIDPFPQTIDHYSNLLPSPSQTMANLGKHDRPAPWSRISAKLRKSTRRVQTTEKPHTKPARSRSGIVKQKKKDPNCCQPRHLTETQKKMVKARLADMKEKMRSRLSEENFARLYAPLNPKLAAEELAERRKLQLEAVERKDMEEMMRSMKVGEVGGCC